MNLFDHVKNLYDRKVKFDAMSVEDRKAYLPYMINRFVSMNLGVVWLVNAIQQHPIPPREHQLALVDALPKQKRFDKYIKSNTEKEEIPELKFIVDYYQVSHRQALDYLTLFTSTDEGIAELARIIDAYGGDSE